MWQGIINWKPLQYADMEFLNRTALWLVSRYPEGLEKVCVVLPNRRSGLYLEKHLVKHINRPVFLPKITPVQDFIMELSGAKAADEYTCLLTLYRCYREIFGADAETFEEFAGWGPKLLDEFDETDRYLADAGKMFAYLREEKNLALWQLDHQPLSRFQQSYLDFFNRLHPLYESFTTLLKSKGLNTYGMACRHVVEELKSGGLNPEYENVVFAGLNALTASEEWIAGYLYSAGRAGMLWDCDKYYMENHGQEAGNFLRDYAAKWKSEVEMSDGFKMPGKKIRILGTSGNVNQARLAAGILKDSVADPQRTALVLNDEAMLMPVLNSMPPNIDECNITMGFPVIQSPAGNFFTMVFKLQETIRKFNSGRKSPETFIPRYPVIQLLNHPWINSGSSNPLLLPSSSFLKPEEILEYTNETLTTDLCRIVLEPWQENVSIAFENLLEIIKILRKKLCDEPAQLNMLAHIYRALIRIRDSFDAENTPLSVGALSTLFSQCISYAKVPFHGEPLRGLQVMGMLETRSLDFENLIMLSVNEDVLPRSKGTSGFIPLDVRIKFGLPTYRQQEQIFAYHFYRSLQHSREIWLIYNNRTSGRDSGEYSRFIAQLLAELPMYAPEVEIVHQTVDPGNVTTDKTEIRIPKTGDIMEQIRRNTQKGISPSALNKLVKCGLSYYFCYVAGIREPEKPEELLNNKQLGSLMHQTLQMLFQPYLNQSLTHESYSEMRERMEDCLLQSFVKLYPERKSFETETGKNYLMMQVIRDYLRRFLERSAEICSGSNIILHLEDEISAVLSVKTARGEESVKILGIPDRIERSGDLVIITDYKTGKRENNLNVEKVLNEKYFEKQDYILQLLLYDWLYRMHNNYHGSIRPVIEWLIYNSSEPGILSSDSLPGISNGILDSVLPEFEEWLNHILSNLLDDEQDFVQTDNHKICDLCEFKAFCNR